MYIILRNQVISKKQTNFNRKNYPYQFLKNSYVSENSPYKYFQFFFLDFLLPAFFSSSPGDLDLGQRIQASMRRPIDAPTKVTISVFRSGNLRSL